MRFLKSVYLSYLKQRHDKTPVGKNGYTRLKVDDVDGAVPPPVLIYLWGDSAGVLWPWGIFVSNWSIAWRKKQLEFVQLSNYQHPRGSWEMDNKKKNWGSYILTIYPNFLQQQQQQPQRQRQRQRQRQQQQQQQHHASPCILLAIFGVLKACVFRGRRSFVGTEQWLCLIKGRRPIPPRSSRKMV